LAGLAYCELDAESFVAAILHFKQALGLAPEFGEAIIGLAEAYKMRGDKDEAVSYYKRYLQVLPNGSRATMAQKNLRDLESGVSEAVEHGSNESEGRRALPRPPVVEDSAL
jgi:tetratricopeptide (TPR) repeat protein